MSQHFGRDKLGVDKSGLPQSKHFATLFFFKKFFHFQVGSWTDHAGKDYVIRLRTNHPRRAEDLLSQWTLPSQLGTGRRVGLYCSRLAS